MEELLQDFSPIIQLLIVMVTFSLLPLAFACMTSFLRYIIVFSLVKTALGTQQVPPSMVIVGLSIILTIYTMMPIFNQMHQDGFAVYKQTGSASLAIQKSSTPLKEFMMKQTRQKDAIYIYELTKAEPPNSPQDISLLELTPAFIMSEIKSSFDIGFLLFLPFVVIDLIISNVLLAMGMFMLSPTVISIPFKLLVFLGVDGWNLVTKGFMNSFN